MSAQLSLQTWNVQGIAIRETSDGQIIVAGAQDEPAETQQDAIRLLEMGSLSRSTGSAAVMRFSHVQTRVSANALLPSPSAIQFCQVFQPCVAAYALLSWCFVMHFCSAVLPSAILYVAVLCLV